MRIVVRTTGPGFHLVGPVLALCVIVAAGPGGAQSVEPARCPELIVIPGLSNPEDRVPHRCNLDGPSALLSTLEAVPVPMYYPEVQGRISVVIDVDGRADADFTRPLTGSLDSHFHRQLMEAVKGFRYQPGTVDGSPARFGFDLAVRTGRRADTIPQRLEWRYVSGIIEDSLVGAWEEIEAEPPLTPDQLAMVGRELTRTLREMQVLIPDHGRSYCLLLDGGPQPNLERAVREAFQEGAGHWSGGILSLPGCEIDVEFRRFRIEAPVRSGGGRTVVRASGDFLHNWPPGLDGQWWRAWTARCVVPDAPEEWDGTRCDVGPVYSGDATIDGWARAILPEPSNPDAPVSVSVEVTTVGAFRTDTLVASIPEIPSLAERAVFLSGTRSCRGGTSYMADADRETEGEIVAWLRFPDRFPRGILHLLAVRRREADSRFPGYRCDDSERVEERSAVFTLGGVGLPLRGAARVCVIEPDCSLSFYLDPETHELAVAPHVSFRLGDLRDSARHGTHLHFRVRVDRAISGLVAFAVMQTPGDRMTATVLQPRGDREFDYRVNRTPPYPPETEVVIYLATIPAPTAAAPP